MKPLTTYIIGFVSSLVLTGAAYVSVVYHVFSAEVLLPLIICLAVIQFVVQVFFFLHLGAESKPRWQLVTFLFMLMVLLIVVIGSLWIMGNLNYHNLSPNDTTNYIMNDEGIHK